MQTDIGTTHCSTGPIQLTVQDLTDAGRLNIRQAFFARKFLFKLMVAVFVAGPLLCLFFYHALARPAQPGEVFMVGALSVAGFVLTVFGLNYLSAPRQTSKIFKQHKTLHKPYTFHWNERGVELTSEIGDARLAWTDLLKMREDSKIMLFYESEQIYRVIPKRVLTEDQIVSLRQSWIAGHG